MLNYLFFFLHTRNNLIFIHFLKMWREMRFAQVSTTTSSITRLIPQVYMEKEGNVAAKSNIYIIKLIVNLSC